MLSSLLRPKKMVRRAPKRLPPPPHAEAEAEQSNAMGTRRDRAEACVRYAAADWTETDNDDEDSDDDLNNGREGHIGSYDGDEGHNGSGSEDGDEATPLLPIFSAAHLDDIPVYSLTHSIRFIVLPRSETTLSWDQLRSPQVSQFLVKPIQQQIRASHFSRATLYALMTNCLQFGKEARMNPGNAGISRTRAMVCELLAIKLLKEFSTRELIDALSYDFYPLQGLGTAEPSARSAGRGQNIIAKPVAARISALEVAIRAQAKRFLAHPLVVQQLEAIWAGTIVFHSAADQLHRHRPRIIPQQSHYGATAPTTPRPEASRDKLQPGEQWQSELIQVPRRVVTLYDPRDASLFKLSRLRVPRYRQFFSTCSLAMLLCLYLAVLNKRSSEITGLEVLFWLWSAGFMLDEIVGFNEQGFSLYILSFWNSFDLGILLFFIIYYCMRLYGIFAVDLGKDEWDSMSYDILAANAVLLFPRLFSVLDHYRYFSQLLIAFRLMVVDLAAIFILIIIACSGFFVAFTMAFTDGYDASAVAYTLFQIFLGFTPAAWNVWPEYSLLGRAILTLFMFICHFLIVTILITVLTNSFMAIVSNANEEHQFVFAINTISMVKSDALFSYVAPGNILAWFLTPLRFFISFRQFVKLNRYFIKVTHFPLLVSIYAYERLFLARRVFEPTDLVENQGKRRRAISFVDPDRVGLFTPSLRIRQESESGYQKDRALDDVFRLAPRQSMRSTTKSGDRRRTTNIVANWIEQHDGIVDSPPEQDRSIVELLERKREVSRRQSLVKRDRRSRRLSGTRSVGSAPVSVARDFAYPRLSMELPAFATGGHTEDDGDDELLTNEEDENVSFDKASHGGDSNAVEDDDYFQTPTTTRFPTAVPSSEDLTRRPHFSPITSPAQQSLPKPRPPRHGHSRNLSSTTILYNPVSTSRTNSPKKISASPPKLHPQEKATQPTASSHSTPYRRNIFAGSKSRPIISTRSTTQPSPNHTTTSQFGPDFHSSRPVLYRRPSLDTGGFDLASDTSLPDPDLNLIGAVPSSFATQMAMATGLVKPIGDDGGSTDRMMVRLMLARMKTLEEGFQEMLKEVKEIRASGTGANSPVDTVGSRESRRGKGREKGKGILRRRERPVCENVASEGEPECITPGRGRRMLGDLLEKGSSC